MMLFISGYVVRAQEPEWMLSSLTCSSAVLCTAGRILPSRHLPAVLADVGCKNSLTGRWCRRLCCAFHLPAGAGFLMWELSTPFMHFRWFLYKIGKDTTKLYQYNALAGMAVFFLCRILWGNFLSIMFWVDSVRVLATPAGATLPMAAIWVYRVATVVMNGLNAWWFSKMVTTLLEAVRGSSSRGMSKKVTAKAL
eukprot:GHRQ01026056.1.p1 GENE.GHRQ01026056.1~~GHRQ01026056.1.p1  ORF type:complete len:195 (-),score=40.50 GHRQ01026056.1:112-696(-)